MNGDIIYTALISNTDGSIFRSHLHNSIEEAQSRGCEVEIRDNFFTNNGLIIWSALVIGRKKI